MPFWSDRPPSLHLSRIVLVAMAVMETIIIMVRDDWRIMMQQQQQQQQRDEGPRHSLA